MPLTTVTSTFPRVTLRPVKFTKDCIRIWLWRNDQDTRMRMFETSPIGLWTHARWLWNALRSERRLLFIAEELGAPIGVIRVDLYKVYAELSIVIAPDARGRRLASQVIELATDKAWFAGVSVCHANIRRDNDKSLRAFMRAGYEVEPGHRAGGATVRLIREVLP